MVTVIEIEIEEALLDQIDEAALKIGVSRTIFMTTAIKHALRHHYPKELTQPDETNTYLLWLTDEGDPEDWLDAQHWDDPWEGPDSSHLN